MKKTTKPPSDIHPLASSELAELYRKNPTPELRIALWEIARLKTFIVECRKEVCYVEQVYYKEVGKPVTGFSAVKYKLKREIDEQWPERRDRPRPPIYEFHDPIAEYEDAEEKRWLRKHGQ
jgi:hypothetical protein